MELFEAIVIGAGHAGTPLSVALAQAGNNTALVERQHVGGICINEGCTPNKNMIASARVAYLARGADDYGVNTGSVTVNEANVRMQPEATSFQTFVGPKLASPPQMPPLCRSL